MDSPATLKLTQTPRIPTKFASYPEHVKPKLTRLRQLILAVADETDEVSSLVETLKWGEPSYLAPKGSTVRMDWKAKKPDQYAMYFKCTSKLVATFREVYGDTFKYEDNRAIVFGLEDAVPEAALKTCIRAALSYHVVKDKPLLNMLKAE